MDTSFDLNRWDSLKMELQKKYPQLTNADLIWRHESKDDLFWMISTKLGIPKKRLEELLESFNQTQ